ncbi:MAG: hypothetical protein IJL96_07415 [Clostridia bacterium]|nr:hypothetical protein [Clostridia bacterium]
MDIDVVKGSKIAEFDDDVIKLNPGGTPCDLSVGLRINSLAAAERMHNGELEVPTRH